MNPHDEIRWVAKATCGKCRTMYMREAISKEKLVGDMLKIGWRFGRRKGWFCEKCASTGDKGYVRSCATGPQAELFELMEKYGRWAPTKFATELGVSRQTVYERRWALEKKGLLPPLHQRLSVPKTDK